jgi:hypothetical protein
MAWVAEAQAVEVVKEAPRSVKIWATWDVMELK